jgi:hypothetical protein
MKHVVFVTLMTGAMLLASGVLADESLLAPHSDTNQDKNGLQPRVQSHIDVLDIPKEGPVGALGAGDLQVSIVNRDVCAPAGNNLTYRIFIRNAGESCIQINEVLNTFGNASHAHSEPEGEDLGGGVRWAGGPLLQPLQFFEYFFTATAGGGELTNRVTVQYNVLDEACANPQPAQVSTTHSVGEQCKNPPTFIASLPNNLAAIICDISEISCQQFFPQLGRRFAEAINNPNLQALICAQQQYRGSAECINNTPTLGARFNHPNQPPAPTILPGECRVLEDAGPSPANPAQGPPVEVTWCESNGYPEFVLQRAPEPAKAKTDAITLPDTSALNGALTQVQGNLVRGTPCGGNPGDPFWAPGCSCNCTDATCRPLIAEAGIHDLFVVTQEECLQDIHDPFF